MLVNSSIDMFTLNKEAVYSSETFGYFEGVRTQNTGLLIFTVVRTSKPKENITCNPGV
jgi:hypothetical protein